MDNNIEKYHEAIFKHSQMVKLNLGSGFLALNDWINYDNSILVKLNKLIPVKYLAKAGLLPPMYLTVKFANVKICNLKKGIPHKDSSVDCIYTSHFLEHLYRYQAIEILKECHRVLKPDGILRVSVPDVEKLRSILNTDHFCTWFYPEYLNMQKPTFMMLVKELFLRHHKWMYDYWTMAKIINEAGFKRVSQKKHGESEIEDAKKLDTYPEHSLFVEARKT